MSLAKSISTVDNDPILLSPPSFELLEELENMVRDKYNFIPVEKKYVQQMYEAAQEEYKGPQTLRKFLSRIYVNICMKHYRDEIKEPVHKRCLLMTHRMEVIIKILLKNTLQAAS